jgi:hypothetical protein
MLPMPTQVQAAAAVQGASSGWADLARFGRESQAPSVAATPRDRWHRSVALQRAQAAAQEMQDAARLKAMQRTPYPLLLARMKV